MGVFCEAFMRSSPLTIVRPRKKTALFKEQENTAQSAGWASKVGLYTKLQT